KAMPENDEEIKRHEIDKLKNRLYSIGESDAEVETEYEEVNQRVEYLTGQIGDLEKAKEDLETLIKDLDLKIKKQFEISFESISKKFKHFFELLFDGGEAKLELLIQKDEDGGNDKLGIEITAVPPGKRVKSLSALSGGERTLTSLALLFAILSVNPAPFILLDEVDAALDESNTKRFIKIVHELSKATQFIFITHNRETMKEANIIYGVTMDDSHASRLLSVKLNDALDVIDKKPHSKKVKK
ncbi:AAA family ATPase, partial [Patescibacteria group bacterium]|nr:AAA family ATPase [Patescibacteria group bacterium]